MKSWLKNAAADPNFFVGPALMIIGVVMIIAGLIWAILSFQTGNFDNRSIVATIIGVALFFIGTPQR